MIKTFLVKISRFLLISFGCLLITSYIWVRFLRDRPGKEIPFEITFDTLIIFLLISNLYLFFIIYILYDSYIPYNKYSSKILNTLKKPFIPLFTFIISIARNIIYVPLIAFDTYIKEHKFVRNIYKKLILNIIYLFPLPETSIFRYKFKQWFDNNDIDQVYQQGHFLFDCYFWTYILFTKFPRFILLFVLLLDIFYFKHLFFIYKFAPLAFFLFFFNYLLYCFKEFLEHQILWLESICDAIQCEEWANNKGYEDGEAESLNISYDCLTPRRFIKEQSFQIVFDFIPYEFTARPDYPFIQKCKESNLHPWKEFNRIIKEEILPVACIIEYIKFTKLEDSIKLIDLIIYGSYFICINYLLFRNLSTQLCLIYFILY